MSCSMLLPNVASIERNGLERYPLNRILTKYLSLFNKINNNNNNNNVYLIGRRKYSIPS